MTTGSSISGGKSRSLVPRMNTADEQKSRDYQVSPGEGVMFLPSPRLKLLYLTYLFFIVWAVVMPVLMVISITYPPSVSLPVSVAALVVVLISLVWVRKFCGSVRYLFSLREDHAAPGSPV